MTASAFVAYTILHGLLYTGKVMKKLEVFRFSNRAPDEAGAPDLFADQPVMFNFCVPSMTSR
jgi:hypothetical protein